MQDSTSGGDFDKTEMGMSIPKTQLSFEKRLGEGSFGEVYKGTWSPTSVYKIPVALKQLKNASMSAKCLEDFKREVDIQSKLDSSGVVKLYGITLEQPYCMVMEFMECGSLRDVLDAQKPEELHWDIRIQIAKNMVSGLAYLHGQNPVIIHGDLKSLNILVNSKNEAKLADFGLAVLKTEARSNDYSQGNTEKIIGLKGSFLWRAPELFRMNGKRTQASDIFSLAVIFWELASHLLPYENAHGDSGLIQSWVKDGEREAFDERAPNTPQEYSELTQRCWDADPTKRPSAENIATELEALYSSRSLAPTMFSLGSKLSPKPIRKPGVGSGGYLANTGSGPTPVKSSGYLVNSPPPSIPSPQKPTSQLLQKKASQKMPPVPSKPAQVVQLVPVAETPNARVNEKAASVRRIVSEEAIKQLLLHTVQGEVDKVRECLTRNRDLVHAQEDITDLRERLFPKITGFQRVIWDGDEELCNVYLEFLPEVEAYDQLMALINERPDIAKNHGAPLSFFDALLTGYRCCKDNFKEWSNDREYAFWCKEVGGAHCAMPAWFVYIFSEEGRDKAWPTEQITRVFTRDLKHLRRWFDSKYNDGKCGEKFAWFRGNLANAAHRPYEVGSVEATRSWHFGNHDMDAKNTAALKSECTKKLAVLTERLSQAAQETQKVSSVPSMGNRK